MNRITYDWNKLRNEVIEAKTVNGFKRAVRQVYYSTESYHSVRNNSIPLNTLSKLFNLPLLKNNNNNNNNSDWEIKK